MPPRDSWLHDADHIMLLQQAHADHIESIYSGLANQPGNPDGILLRTFGDTRTFIAHGARIENRIIFNGNESLAEMDAILDDFEQHHAFCFVEVNPANFYRSHPFSWNAELLSHLVARGCRIRHFRCVWQRTIETDTAFDTNLDTNLDTNPKLIVLYRPDQIESYMALARQVESPSEEEERRLRYGESQAGWYHFVGFAGDLPCATATLFVKGGIGYLAQAYTHPDYRGRGYQRSMIRERLRLAGSLGCRLAFSVTDSYTQSARNLQQEGFSLAYNYLMLIRDSSAPA